MENLVSLFYILLAVTAVVVLKAFLFVAVMGFFAGPRDKRVKKDKRI